MWGSPLRQALRHFAELLRQCGEFIFRSLWVFWNEKIIYLTQLPYRKNYQDNLVAWIKDKRKFSFFGEKGDLGL